MTKEECIRLMESSNSRREWNHNCDVVKSAFGGDYPTWWYETIVSSGLADATMIKWMMIKSGGKDMAL